MLLPYGIVEYYYSMKKHSLDEIRKERLNSFESRIKNDRCVDYDYEKSIHLLRSFGLNEEEIRSGSVPEESLNFMKEKCALYLKGKEKLVALHVGNFVGVSLAYLSNSLIKLSSESIIISIDPNISHRGIINPQSYLFQILDYFGLNKNNIILTGYSLGKNVANDGGVFYATEEEANPIKVNPAPENLLEHFANLGIKVDLCFIDGNHETNYLQNEIIRIDEFLCSEGFLIIDDVGNGWDDVEIVFKRMENNPSYKLVATDNRIGIFQKL